MIRTFAIALLLAGSGVPGGTASQPDWQGTPKAAPAPAPAPNVWVSTSGRSYLGVDIQDVTSDRISALKLKEERGVEVTMVDQDAPAGKAGVKEHDVIVDFNGTAVESEEQLRRMIREIPPGRTVTLGISRDGNPMKISVQLGDRGKIAANSRRIMVAPMPRIELPRIEIPSFSLDLPPMIGAQTETLPPQLAAYFGVREGVLIRSVEKGGAAEKAGLKAGDIIVRADEDRIAGRSDLTSMLRKHREGGKVTLGIVRKEKEQNVVVDLPNRGGTGDSSWRIIDMDEIQSLRDEIEEMKDQVEPEIEHVREMAALKMYGDAAQLRVKMRELKPALEKSLRENQRELRHLRERLQQEMKKDFGPMI